MNEGFRNQKARFSIETRLTSHLNISNHFDTFSKVLLGFELLEGFLPILKIRANIKVPRSFEDFIGLLDSDELLMVSALVRVVDQD